MIAYYQTRFPNINLESLFAKVTCKYLQGLCGALSSDSLTEHQGQSVRPSRHLVSEKIPISVLFK